MEVQKQLEIIRKWQTSEMVHPLTCRDDCDGILYPEVHGGCTKHFNQHIILHCPICDYRQEFIPDFIFSTNIEKLEEMRENLFGEEK